MKFENVLAERPQKVIYRDGDRCVKVFVPNYSKAAIFNEASNHVRIEEKGLNIPKVLGVENIDGSWAIATQFIEGKTLEQLIEAYPEKKETYFRILADLQSEIQTLGGAGAEGGVGSGLFLYAADGYQTGDEVHQLILLLGVVPIGFDLSLVIHNYSPSCSPCSASSLRYL